LVFALACCASDAVTVGLASPPHEASAIIAAPKRMIFFIEKLIVFKKY
jgi:hypothetical protein